MIPGGGTEGSHPGSGDSDIQGGIQGVGTQGVGIQGVGTQGGKES